MTRGALTTFSIANDVSKYFAIIPAAFVAPTRSSSALNVMRLHSPTSAVLSAVIFNALIIIALIPLALRGIKYRAAPAAGHCCAATCSSTGSAALLPFPSSSSSTSSSRRPGGSCHEARPHRILRPALVSLLAFTVLTGVVYPLAGHRHRAGAVPAPGERQSLIDDDGKVVGSELIGQPFDDPAYFWSRPSATAPLPYNATPRRGSNLGPTESRARTTRSQARIEALRAADPGNTAPVPVDLVTASAVGLDPHISPAAALLPGPARRARARARRGRGARARRRRTSKGRTLGMLGEPRVNVLAAQPRARRPTGPRQGMRGQ